MFVLQKIEKIEKIEIENAQSNARFALLVTVFSN